MKACILLNDMQGTEMEDSWLPYDPTSFVPSAYQIDKLYLKDNAVRELLKYHSAHRPDVYINMTDGSPDEDRAGMEVLRTLEMLQVPYTGATSSFFWVSRRAIEQLTNTLDAQFPRYVEVFDRTRIRETVASKNLPYPVIVKHWDGYNSIGMTPESLCYTPMQMAIQVEKMLGLFGGARVEEFIIGQELTVLVQESSDKQEPYVYPPVAFSFPEGTFGFKHFARKWAAVSEYETIPIVGKLAKQVGEIARDLFVGLEGTGYARIDFRLDADGILYVLDVNANCGIFNRPGEESSADLILQIRNEQSLFMERMLEQAHRMVNQRYHVGPTPTDKMGMIANQDFDIGDLVYQEEEKVFRLVSKQHMQTVWKHWYKKEGPVFCFPVGVNSYLYWDQDPRLWNPVNHSCEPNIGYQGDSTWNMYALRPIRKGEELLVDYAAFYDDLFPPIQCVCGSAECRGTVSGLGFRTRWKSTSNVSPYLASFKENTCEIPKYVLA